MLEGAEDRVVSDAVGSANLLRVAFLLGQGEKNVLGGNIFILEPVGVLLRGKEYLIGRWSHAQLRAGGAGQPIEMRGDGCFNPADIGAELLQEWMKDAFLLRQQRAQ